MTRDPRTDPRAGDCLRKGKFKRTVTMVRYVTIDWNTQSGRHGWGLIKDWQSWSRDAEIVTTAKGES